MVRTISLAVAATALAGLTACSDPVAQREASCVGGTIAGAAAGGLLGNQVGAGTGNTLATAIGAMAGGAAAANQMGC